MEAKNIIISVVKSNKSENNVWAVSITGEEQKQAYCKSAYKAMRFAFLLKKRTGCYIEELSLKSLSSEIARRKAAKAAAEAEKAAAEAEQQAESLELPELAVAQPEAEKPKKQRKPRAKKAKLEQPTELVAFL